MRFLCWADRLSEYQFDVIFRIGADNPIADLLSLSEAEATHEIPLETATSIDVFICTVLGNETLLGLNLMYIA